MDVIYHRNCMDGAYSAYLLYLLSKSLTPQAFCLLRTHLLGHKTQILQPFQTQQLLLVNHPSISQQFFHEPPQIPFHSISMCAGDLFPIAPSTSESVLFMVDISPCTREILLELVSRYAVVVVFDHHSSFINTIQLIQENGVKNLLYLFQEEGKCAAQIVEQYFFQGFGLGKNFGGSFWDDLLLQIKYVASNDLKLQQNPLSKQFTLGFYFFKIQLSHQNPLLFKRLWHLKLETILQKGKSTEFPICRYMLKKQIQNCQIWRLQKCKYQNETFLAAQTPYNRGLISDLGSLLAFLSCGLGFSNLAMIYTKKGYNQERISFRSIKGKEEPMALKISEYFGGGGHVHAAGCMVNKGSFTQHFTMVGHPKPKIQITEQQIQQILFHTT